MAKKSATKAEKAHMSRVQELGCIACETLGHFGTPAEIHHIRAGQGVAQRASNTKVLPLCPWHHRTGGYGHAFHAGDKTWQDKFGYELDLLEEINDRLGIM